MLLLLMMMLDADADADAAGARVVHADVMCMCMCCTYVALCMSCAYDVHVLALLRMHCSYTPGPAYFQRARSERRRRTAHAALHRRGAPVFHAGARARSGRADS